MRKDFVELSAETKPVSLETEIITEGQGQDKKTNEKGDRTFCILSNN